MGTTANYGWRYQELGDAPDGAGLGQNLANDVEATVQGIDGRVSTLETQVLPYAKLSKVAQQTIPNATGTAVTFSNVESESPAGFADLANNRLVVPETGVYDLAAQIRYAVAASGVRTVRILVNGTAIAGNGSTASSNGASTEGGHFASLYSPEVQLSAGDAITLDCYQTSGGDLLTSSATGGTYLYARKVR